MDHLPLTQNTYQQRNRAWRRKINFLNRGRDCRHTSNLWKPEKNWKNLWTRSLKQSRAKQLGIEYPRISSAKKLKQSKYDYLNILFVCSQNKWRSPTAENIFAVGFGIHTRSAGTSKHAKHTITIKDILWADLIFVMEYKHKKSIQEKFRKELQHKKVIVLEIPDDYQYMDDELIKILKISITPYLK